ncbi:MAG: 1,4-dihydroxy-2-naphthoate octaprenyltransferase [Crocinitomicaceae bacterium TMED114]|nr:MAG: 1,4-dihydroxy-2-naphthoate octaprenyltransferase [Crocinitomicaceae bacterium TMED114]
MPSSKSATPTSSSTQSSPDSGMLRDYIQAARLRTLPLASACILTGGALAAATGDVASSRFTSLFLGCLLTVVLLQVLSNFANDLGDFENGADRVEGSERSDRAVASGRITAAQMKRAVLLTGALAFITGTATVALAVGDAWLQLLLWVAAGAVSIIAAYTYTAGQRPYGYSGLGDISVLIFFGFTGVAGTAALITGQMNPLWWLPAATIGLLSVAVLNLNNLRDHVSDAATGKHTLVVRMGFQKAKRYHLLLVVGAWTALLTFWQLDPSGPWRGQLWYGLFGLVHARHLAFVFRTEDPAELDGELKKIALSTFAIALFLFLSATA